MTSAVAGATDEGIPGKFSVIQMIMRIMIRIMTMAIVIRDHPILIVIKRIYNGLGSFFVILIKMRIMLSEDHDLDNVNE